MTPFTLFVTLILGVFVLSLPRKYAVIPMIIGICYITLGQKLFIAGMDFSVIRLLVTVGWVRVVTKRELNLGQITSVDKLVIYFVVTLIITGTVQEKTFSAFINRGGNSYDIIGVFFYGRCVIREIKDVNTIFKAISIIFVPLAISMFIEKITGRNFFSFLGGVAEFSAIRNGSLRSQGPFLHPILAGTVGVTFLPCVLTLWWQKKSKIFCVIGVIASLVITFTPSSSGPIGSLLVIIVGIFIWYLRAHLSLIRKGILFTLIGLQLVMKAPVWYLLARIDLSGGSTGDHRAALISSAIAHLSEWWLCGTNYTRHWMPTGVSWSPDHTDITNQYIQMGVIGGLPTMILFILLIVKCYKCIGNGLLISKNAPFKVQIIFWALGLNLLGHTFSFISVVYFDQSASLFYLALAIITSASTFSEEDMII